MWLLHNTSPTSQQGVHLEMFIIVRKAALPVDILDVTHGND